MTFTQTPRPFLWGAATSSYQIEGAVDEDGRGPSIWDELCKRPGAVLEGASGSVACDHYHRLEEDLDLMASLGLNSYRFSIAWPRIFPKGTGKLNQAGVDFYSRLVDGLLARGIEPNATLYHWDLPQALEEKGGWRKRETADAFANYTEAIASRLGDRVKMWATFNELWCIIHHGHVDGHHAPGAREPLGVVRQVMHNLFVAHGLGVRALRAAVPDAHVGLVHNPGVPEPMTESDEDVAATREAFHRINAGYLDPIFRGVYPADEMAALGKDAPLIREGDMEIISSPMDWFGVNVYFGAGVIRAGSEELIPYEKHHPRTHMDWVVTPDVLHWACKFIQEICNPPEMYITESGCAYPDQVGSDGGVNDIARVQYLREHLRGALRAKDQGIRIRGYYAWSLLDNFEWAWGYQRRFGIVHVNYETLKRTPKASAHWYAGVIRAAQSAEKTESSAGMPR